MRTIGINGVGVVPIILWSKPHQFGKFDGGGAGGGGDQQPMRMSGLVPHTMLGWFTMPRTAINAEMWGTLGIRIDDATT